MSTIKTAIICGLLLLTPCVYGQSSLLERRLDFTSNGMGLTETLLKFSHEEHLPVAIEYVDQRSMDRPVSVRLRNKTIRQALDFILLEDNGYGWKVREGIIEVTNMHASKRAEGLFDRVIPVFTIAEGETAQMSSIMLWWNLQMELDPKKGFAGDAMGGSSSVKRATLRNRSVRQILSYIVRNSGAEGWIVSGPPECLGFTPYCGLWYLIEGDSCDASRTLALQNIRKNFVNSSRSSDCSLKFPSVSVSMFPVRDFRSAQGQASQTCGEMPV
jgi:hypothetical protein